MSVLLSLVVFLSLIVPMAAAADTPAQAVLRIGSSLNDSNAEAFYALEKGFFKQEGLDVQVTAFNNGAAAAAALASGDIDISIQPPMQIAQGVARGLPFVIIAAGAMNSVSAPAAWVCVAASSSIKSAKDLEGKTIALNSLRSSSENVLDAWLAKNGADIKKVRVIELPSSQMAAAVVRGTVDAAELFEPAFTAAMQSNEVRVLAVPTSAMSSRNEYLQTAWLSTRQFAEQHRDILKRFSRAIYRAAQWANSHPRDSGAILARLSKLDPGVVNTMVRTHYAESLQVRDLLPELDNGVKFGLLPRAVSPSEMLLR